MKEPTMKEVLELVEFQSNVHGKLFICDVNGTVWGDVHGTVKGTIEGRKWEFAETPIEKAIRLIREGKGEEAIDVLEISGVCGD